MKRRYRPKKNDVNFLNSELDQIISESLAELEQIEKQLDTLRSTKQNESEHYNERTINIFKALDFVSDYLREHLGYYPLAESFQFPHLIRNQALLRLLTIHTLKDYPELHESKVEQCLSKLDVNFLKKKFYEFFQQFVKAFNRPCIDNRMLDATPIREVYKYLVNTMGEDCYRYLLERFTESYSFYRTPETSAYILSFLAGMYFKDTQLVEYVLMCYGSFVFSRMFIQFFKYCNPDLLAGAIQSMRSNSLFARYKTNYLEIVAHIVATKFHTLMSKDTLTAHNVSLLFSTIKVRTKDALQNLAQKYYQLDREGYHKDTQIAQERTDVTSSSEIAMFVELASNYILTQVHGVNDEVLSTIARKLQISFFTAQVFIGAMLEVIRTYSVERLKNMLYVILTVAGIPTRDEICSYELLKKLDRLLRIKVGERSTKLKQVLDSILIDTLNKLEQDGVTNISRENILKYPSTRAKYRKFILFYLYIVAIRPAICSV